MKKLLRKTLSIVFVCNTVISLGAPIPTYAEQFEDKDSVTGEYQYNFETVEEDVGIELDDKIENSNEELENPNELDLIKESLSDEISKSSEDSEGDILEDKGNNSSYIEEEKIIEDDNSDSPSHSDNTSTEDIELHKIEDNNDELNYEEKSISTFSIQSDQTDKNTLVDEDIVGTGFVESLGWQNSVNNGDIIGTTGKGLRLESFKIESLNPDISVDYRAHSKRTNNWLPWVENNASSNSIDSNDQIEAIQVKLNGALSDEYDIYYRVHAQSFGWLGWAKNGESAGTIGYNYRIEAIEVRVISVNDDKPNQSVPSYQQFDMNGFNYQTHVQSYGWQPKVGNGIPTGAIDTSRRLEAFRANISKPELNISYRGKVSGSSNWSDWTSNDQFIGTVGQAKALESVEMKLDGAFARHYSIYYRVKVEGLGWLAWASQGQSAGTEGLNSQLEAIEIKIIPRNSNSISTEGEAFIEKIEPVLSGSAHVQSYGWLTYGENQLSMGVTGQRKRMEALKFSIDTGNLGGGIEYRSLVEGEGWHSWQRDGRLSGTEGKAKRLEAIEIRLYGEIAEQYDLVYRSHVESYGWLEPVISGMTSGSVNLYKRMEALEVTLVEKGSVNVSSNNGVRRAPTISTSAHVQTHGWMSPRDNGSIVGTIGQRKRLEALKIAIDTGHLSGGIEYRAHVQGEGWQNWRRDGQLSGTEGQQKRLEAVEIRLYGEVARHYDVTYKTHIESYGWLGAVVSGMPSGSQMLAKRMEAIELDIVKKGSVRVNPDDGFKRAPIVFIDIGHGGKDPGASYFGITEAWLNLSTGTRVISSLRQKGFDVRASRESDIHLYLHERAAMANKIQPDIFFSIHYNAMGGNNIHARGIETFIYHRVASGFGQETNRNNFNTNDPRIAESLKLADAIHKNVINDTNMRDRGVKGNNFHVLRETTVPAALIELGFIDNLADNAIIRTEAYHQKAADAIVKGIVEYFGDWK